MEQERLKRKAVTVKATAYILMVPRAGLEPAQEFPLPPQDSVSTNSTTRAFILFLFLIAEYHYFCFQLLEQLVVAVVELVQQFEINRQMNLFVRYRGEN